MAKYEISRIVISEAKKLGFDEPILPKLKKMLINSDLSKVNAVTKHLQTRTFEDYDFSVYNGVVCRILKKRIKKFSTPTEIKCLDCKDTKKINVFEDCMNCNGTGEGIPGCGSDCAYCFGKGGINKTIPCQSCIDKKMNFKDR